MHCKNPCYHFQLWIVEDSSDAACVAEDNELYEASPAELQEWRPVNSNSQAEYTNSNGLMRSGRKQ